jgi:hypothetical protein
MNLGVNNQVHLSEFRPSDKPALVEYLNDRGIYDGTLRVPFPYTDADVVLLGDLGGKSEPFVGHPVHFAIRTGDNSLIGGCGFDGLQVGKSHRGRLLAGKAVLGPLFK